MTELKCWNCGTSLHDIPRPISRHANCPACFNELHCCRMCVQFDPSLSAGQCAEERADPPVIKEGANFCDWFAPNDAAYQPETTTKKQAALTRLDALFNSPATESDQQSDSATEDSRSKPLTKQHAAKAELDRLFSPKDRKPNP